MDASKKQRLKKVLQDPKTLEMLQDLNASAAEMTRALKEALSLYPQPPNTSAPKESPPTAHP
jgi:hypothetical protein